MITTPYTLFSHRKFAVSKAGQAYHLHPPENRVGDSQYLDAKFMPAGSRLAQLRIRGVIGALHIAYGAYALRDKLKRSFAWASGAAAAVLLIGAPATYAHVKKIVIKHKVSPAFDGRSFGDAGQYETCRVEPSANSKTKAERVANRDPRLIRQAAASKVLNP